MKRRRVLPLQEVTDDVVLRARARTMQLRSEVMAEIRARLPSGQEFTLVGDGVARPAQVFSPTDWKSDDEGCPALYFDVGWQGGHIEFQLRVTGWGGAVPVDP